MKNVNCISEIKSSQFRRGDELGERNCCMNKEKNKGHGCWFK